MHLLVLLTLGLQVVAPVPAQADSLDALRRLARQKEYRYERLLRTLAPRTLSGGWGSDCDEIVGRFCLRFSEEDPEPTPWRPPAEHIRIVEARKEAIDVFRRLFALVPGDVEAAGPLVRYLVEDGRSGEAVPAARAFAWASADSVWGPLLVGFALHADGEDAEASRSFGDALARMPAEERDRILSLGPLLTGAERDRVDEMEPAARARYRERFWRLADPLFVTPGNERWNAHVARHVWARLLAKAPRVVGAVSWGSDLDELTIRYGVPVTRERIAGLGLGETRILERYHPESLAYARADLSVEGFPELPEPGARRPLEEVRARSSYAPGTVLRMLELPHQVTRFPAGDSVVLRLEAEMALDTLRGSVRTARAGVFLLDTAATTVHEDRAVHRTNGGLLRLTDEVTVAPGRYVYSLEVRDSVSGMAARARYAVDAEPYSPGVLALSDIVLARSFRDRPLPRDRSELRLSPLSSPEVHRGEAVGLYAEAHWLAPGEGGRTRYSIDVALHREDRPGLATRVARWIGRRLGLGGRPTIPRVTWTGDGVAGEPVILALDLGVGNVEPGLYRLEMTVQDLVLGTRRTSSRLLSVQPYPSSSRR